MSIGNASSNALPMQSQIQIAPSQNTKSKPLNLAKPNSQTDYLKKVTPPQKDDL